VRIYSLVTSVGQIKLEVTSMVRNRQTVSHSYKTVCWVLPRISWPTSLCVFRIWPILRPLTPWCASFCTSPYRIRVCESKLTLYKTRVLSLRNEYRLAGLRFWMPLFASLCRDLLRSRAVLLGLKTVLLITRAVTCQAWVTHDMLRV